LFAIAACCLCRKPGPQPKRKPRKRAIFESVVNCVDGTGALDEVLVHWSGGPGTAWQVLNHCRDANRGRGRGRWGGRERVAVRKRADRG
jgi:hypothetical protein